MNRGESSGKSGGTEREIETRRDRSGEQERESASFLQSQRVCLLRLL